MITTTSQYAPIIDLEANLARVPLLGHLEFAVFDLNTYEALCLCTGLLMAPLRLGRN